MSKLKKFFFLKNLCNNQICIEDDCNNLAFFNFKNEENPLYCKNHKKDDMFSIKKNNNINKCKEECCDIKFPKFNFINKKTGLYCYEHKKDDMINIENNNCIENNCSNERLFNYKDKYLPIYCDEHKKDDMINITLNKCYKENCNNIKEYNFLNSPALYCFEHKEDLMFNKRKNNCNDDNCNNFAEYNYSDKKYGFYCFLHKKNDMIKSIYRKCQTYDCKKMACYIEENNQEDLPLFCEEHKKIDMIKFIYKKCIQKECDNYAKFNFQNNEAIYCFDHKLENMINLESKKCIDNYCLLTPFYNFKNEKKALFCKEHRKNGMINLFFPVCKTELCITYAASKKYNGYCLYCYVNKFPDKPVARNYKTKERSVVEFIMNTFPNYTWISDKKFEDGCSRRRPDLLVDLGYQIVIVEVDENQHENYNCICENKRIMEISQDFGHRSIIFIRFNPDKYIENNIEKKSCWKLTKKGICTLKINSKKEWDERLECLKNTVEYWCNPDNKTDKTVEIINLFYDN
jgi:hypothetical protein